ncbi:MAG: cytochrome C oxidase subunit IV family protein [Bacteroidota bacterium]|nr:cytochrome C oxidase subunit IV family protein [Bacteroidota bacterium]
MNGHVVSRKVYYFIFAALMVLLILTISMAYFDLGPFNVIIALVIAIIKATLVILYFMHVRYGSRVTWVFVSAGFFWLIIMFTLTMSDFVTRFSF